MHVRGQNRDQATLFPERLDDLISEDNAVRVIDAFVDSLDLKALGFARIEARGTGRPPYHPGDLLKLYLYSYMYRIRSGRRLERECHKNIEVLWLLHRLAPDDKHHLIVAADVVQSAVEQDQLYRMPRRSQRQLGEKRPPQLRWPLLFTRPLTGP